MTAAADLCAAARAAGLVLTRKGERIHVDSPLGAPLPDALRERILAHRAELLEWLAWYEAADQLLIESSQRIAARYPTGCPLDGPDWQAADEALHAAYHSHDTQRLRRGLARHEDFASDWFVAFEAQARQAGPEGRRP